MFNLKLAEYLVLYNSKILHKSFKLQKSVEYIISLSGGKFIERIQTYANNKQIGIKLC